MRRFWAFGALLALAGCIPATTSGGPSISQSLTTPATPFTYAWVMEHHGYDWWVQIGPKVDADGTHVAVQGWVSCTPGLTTVPSCASYDYFKEFEALTPGSAHSYRVAWNGTGWDCFFDGQLRATLNIGDPNTAEPASNLGEHTSA